ncbi:MAG: NAD(P)/FAD-dependent oxidoreductase [Brumimicrobium sp.]|nr:NAD(P)/FAD-dependent oxidoreductase [Brumimicrobium sp.]
MQSNRKYDVVIIGGGAAGFFAAINMKIKHPKRAIIILEKTTKLLSKVKISGGGRCNITHHCDTISELLKGYPRGSKLLREAFHTFFVSDTIQWFEERGVKLKTEEDGRMFPVTDNSQTIIDCLLGECDRLGIPIYTKMNVVKVKQVATGFHVETTENEVFESEKVVLTTGGYHLKKDYDWIKEIPCVIEAPYPSLFTFNLKKHPITNLMGIAIEHAVVKIPSLKMEQTGPVLITHWGLSGPGVLMLSAWAAKELHQKNYHFDFHVNFLPEFHSDGLGHFLMDYKQKNASKSVQKKVFSELPQRFWNYLIETVEIQDKNWSDCNKKQVFKLAELLTNHPFQAHGKTTFKEEFVSAGGVNLKQVNPKTLESKTVPNLYFAGECLDIDGVTGGYNFQAAWSTSFVVSQCE